MLVIKEKPGIHTPWRAINQLLDNQERLEWQSSETSCYLFAPKTLSKLSALLYLLKEEKLDFSVQNQAQMDDQKNVVLISMRSFSQVESLGEGRVAVGAGSSLLQLQRRLFEEKQELGFEDLSDSYHSIASFLLGAPPMGLVFRQEALFERLLQIEWIKSDGSVVRWGGGLTASGGPCLSPLIGGLRDLKAVLVKIIFKVDLVPPARLFLNWSFLKRDDLWKQFNQLRSWTGTWERLDIVTPKDGMQKGFILAQISGSEREIKSFQEVCPKINEAEHACKVSNLKKFFNQQGYYFQSIKSLDWEDEKQPLGFLWYHGLTGQSWFVHPKKNVFTEKSCEWQKRLQNCLNN